MPAYLEWVFNGNRLDTCLTSIAGFVHVSDLDLMTQISEGYWPRGSIPPPPSQNACLSGMGV